MATCVALAEGVTDCTENELLPVPGLDGELGVVFEPEPPQPVERARITVSIDPVTLAKVDMRYIELLLLLICLPCE